MENLPLNMGMGPELLAANPRPIQILDPPPPRDHDKYRSFRFLQALHWQENASSSISAHRSLSLYDMCTMLQFHVHVAPIRLDYEQ